MKENILEKCIQELNKPNKNRDETIIIDYIKTLESFMNLIQERNEDSEEIIKKIAKIMIHQKNKKNDLIIQYGEKGDDFYIILKGTIGIFVPKYDEYYMDEEEFVLHLLKLRKFNQNELIIQCLRLNSLNFTLPTERFDDLLFYLQNTKKKKDFFVYSKKVINKAKEVYRYINSDEYIINKKKIKNIHPENYISLFEVEENIKKKTENLNYLKKLKIDFDQKDEDKKLVKIPNYEMISKYGDGDIFGELALEHINKKRMATIITLTDCDFAIIDKIKYNELLKDSINKSKNKFYNLIYKYKIFDNVSLSTFDRKYYNHFRYLKMKKNNILFNEGDICDKVYFILNGEYELFIDKNIEEVNQIILQLKEIIDYLKKIIMNETKNIINKNIKNKNKLYIKIKNNLDLFFNKYEKDINLDELAYIIKTRDIVSKKKYLGVQFDKTISDKNRIKLGICKSIQIIGLTDIINRFSGNNKCFFNCKCFSFSGELYYIKYSHFLSIYEKEENVKLYTSQLIFQNLYYLIGRLLSHKKFIYEKAIKKENDFINILYLEEEKNKKINDKNGENKTYKNIINIMTNKIKNNSKNKDINYININNTNIQPTDYNSFPNKTNSEINYRIDNLSLRKNINLNIFSHINTWKIDNISYYNSSSENNNDIYNNINSSNNISKIESYIFSKNNNSNNFNKFKNEYNLLKLKKIKNNFISRNLLKGQNFTSNTRYTKFDTNFLEKKLEFPAIVINDKEIKINQNIKTIKSNNNNNYKNLLKSIDCKNKKLIELINSKEIKNLVIYSDPNDSIEMKQKYKNFFRRKKQISLFKKNKSKLNIENETNKNFQIINSYSDKKNFYSTSYNKDKNRFITYSLSDLNGKHLKEIKLKINESINSVNNNIKGNKFRNNKENDKINLKNKNNILRYRNIYYNYKPENTSKNPLKNMFLKKNLSDTFYSYKIYNKLEKINKII